MNKKTFLFTLLIVILLTIGVVGLYKSKSTSSTKYYLVQIGAYKKIDSASLKSKEFDNYIVHKDNDLYKIYIGVTKDMEVFDKIVRLYSKTSSFYRKEISVSNTSIDEAMSRYDKFIINSNDKNEIDQIIKVELKLFKEILEKDKKK